MRTGVIFTILLLATQALAGCFGEEDVKEEVVVATPLDGLFSTTTWYHYAGSVNNSTAINFPDLPIGGEGTPRISQYAYGKDYHHVIKWKLKELLKFLRNEWGQVEGRVFVDSAPVLERAWAEKSGLGWVGKHSLLISKKSPGLRPRAC